MSLTFNYRHLYYFWVVAKEGSFTRAAERLNVAIQTISTQVRELEQDLGSLLLKPSGRGITLTEAGVATVSQAEKIFELGNEVPAVAREATTGQVVRLAVGVSDALPKQAVHQLLRPILATPNLRLRCDVDEFEDLLADLALHRLDVVLADRMPPDNANLKLHSHALTTSPFAWYATPELYEQALPDFPSSLNRVPLLLPTKHAAIRSRLDAWLERHEINPLVVGEFEDSTLLKTFGAAGMGVYPAAEFMHDDAAIGGPVKRLGGCEGVDEHFYAVATTRKIMHPLVASLVARR